MALWQLVYLVTLVMQLFLIQVRFFGNLTAQFFFFKLASLTVFGFTTQ